MATITEDYVSFETAKLLKEKGFDESISTAYLCCDGKYWDKRFKEMSCDICQNEWYDAEDTVEFGHLLLAPTLQMAMKWLREIHSLHIMVNCVGRVNYDPIIQRFDGKDFEIEGVEVGTTRRINGKWEDVRRGFKTYEAAVEAAIKYCLENLI